MTQEDYLQYIRNYFNQARGFGADLVEKFTDDPDTVLLKAETIYESMIPDIGYLDDQDHPFASAVFLCGFQIAVYLALREQQVDIHDFGRELVIKTTTLIEARQSKTEGSQNESGEDDRRHAARRFKDAAEKSQTQAKPREFVFEVVSGKGEDFDWGQNVTSCAICYMASKRNVSELVPYMCATDDVVSDLGNQGLRRNGSIAVGANQCDFRYEAGGKPQPLSRLYPQLIRLIEEP